MLYYVVSRVEYDKISTGQVTKEIWDKLEVTYEGIGKVKENRINALVISMSISNGGE